MKSSSLVILLTALATQTTHGKGPIRVDRTIVREPAYRSKAPQYGLLVFGVKAQMRVWFVLDGDDLYVDRNANSDLTDKGERVQSKIVDDGEEFGRKVQLCSHRVGPLAARDSKTKYPGAAFTFKRVGPGPAHLRAIVVDLGNYTQMVTAESLALGARPATAPVFHFHGPLAIGTFTTFLSREHANDLRVHIQTPALGNNRPAVVFCTSVPKEVHPVATIEFPSSKRGEKPMGCQVLLKERC